jgi:hypothetical protein
MLTQLLLTARVWMGPSQSVVIRQGLDAVLSLFSGLKRFKTWDK